MNIQQVLERLKTLSYPATENSGTVQIEMTPETLANKVTREEIYAVLREQVPMVEIHQIDDWTIVITF